MLRVCCVFAACMLRVCRTEVRVVLLSTPRHRRRGWCELSSAEVYSRVWSDANAGAARGMMLARAAPG